MRFVYLTYPEIEGIPMRWDETALKTQEMLAAAITAGFSEEEAFRAAVFVVEEGFGLSEQEGVEDGAIALMGTNGDMLVQFATQ